MRLLKKISYLLAALMLVACSRSDGGRQRTIRESIDLWSFQLIGIMLFDSIQIEEMRGVHLAGAGMLNRDVLVKGTVHTIGDERTYMILTDSSARILVDTTRVSAWNEKIKIKVGKSVAVHGEVKSGDKGHIYLLANVIRGE